MKPSNGFRCRIPECDEDGFRFDDFPEEIFPMKKDGSLDYCSYYQPKMVYNLGTDEAWLSISLLYLPTQYLPLPSPLEIIFSHEMR